MGICLEHVWETTFPVSCSFWVVLLSTPPESTPLSVKLIRFVKEMHLVMKYGCFNVCGPRWWPRLRISVWKKLGLCIEMCALDWKRKYVHWIFFKKVIKKIPLRAFLSKRGCRLVSCPSLGYFQDEKIGAMQQNVCNRMLNEVAWFEKIWKSY